MRAVVCDGAGGREVLGLWDLPDPEPGPGELLAVGLDPDASGWPL